MLLSPPTVTGLNPTTGPEAGGTPVSITGTNFTGAMEVDFGATAATGLVVVSDTTITADSPAGMGTVNVTVTNADGTSPVSPGDGFTYLADHAPAITSADNTSFVAGTAGTFTVTTTGFPTPTPITETGTLPTGVTFVDNHDGTATLAGTPAAGTGGTYALTIDAANGVTPDASQSFTLTVDQAPAITSADNTSFVAGTAGTFTVTTTGFPTPTPITETGTLPTGVTFVDNADGTATLAGIPAAGTGGIYALTIDAANGVTPDASQSFTLTVGQAPAITSADSATLTAGAAGSFTVTTTGFPIPTPITETGTLPTGVTFVDNADGTATLAGTPAAGTGGTYALTIDAANGVTPDASQMFTLTVDQAPAITSAASTSFAVGLAGTFTITTTGFPIPTPITETGTLPAGVTFVDNADGTATLSGTPDVGSDGTYPISIDAANGVSPDATQSFTLTVGEPTAPLITSTDSTTFTAGTTGTFTVISTGTPSAALTETGTLPAGVTFVDNADGTATLAGTPAAGTGGTYALTIDAGNGVTPDAMQSFTLTVDQAPAITSADNTTFIAGTVGTFTVTTTGFPVPTPITETGTLPTGVTFVDNHDGTATLAGTPAAGTGGTYAFTIDAANTVSPDATQSFTLTIDQAPAITSADSTTFTVGTAGTFTVTTTGFPIPTPITETGTLPAGVTFVDNTNGTATLAGTPTAGSGGTYAFTISAANNVSPAATQSFTLTVDQAPAITSADSTTFTVGTAATFTVTTTGFPIPTPITETGTLPAGVTFVDNTNGTATLAGTPTAGSGGTYAFTIEAANNVSPAATQSFTLTVDQAPAITSADSTTFTVGTAGTFTVTTTGFPIPTPITETGTLPTGVTFVDNTNGTATLAGTPAAGSGGTYAFTISAANNVSPAATQSFTLTVDQAPAITSADSTTFTVGTAGTFTVTTTGFPIPTPITETGKLPAGVTFVDNTNGTATLAGTPAAGSGGTYAFTISAANNVSPGATQSFTLTVDQAPAITSADSTTFTVGTAGTFTVTTTGFPIPTPITETGKLPAGVTFVDNTNGTATLAGTPAAGSGGTYAFTIDAANNVSPAATQTFTLTVAAAPTVTGLSPTTGSTSGGTSVTITGTGFTGATAVDFGSVAATSFTVVNNTTITAVSPAGAGTVGVTVIAPAGSSSSSAASQFTFVVAAPTVISLVRFGFHMQQTSLVLTFSTALSVAPAENVSNYQIMTANGAVIPVSSAAYDSTNFTVTLIPTQLLSLDKFYQLTVIGTTPNGLTGATGVPLDGLDNGTSGTNYVKTFGGGILIGAAPALEINQPKRFAAEEREMLAEQKHFLAEHKSLAVQQRKLAIAGKTMARAQQKLAAQLKVVTGPTASAFDAVSVLENDIARPNAVRIQIGHHHPRG